MGALRAFQGLQGTIGQPTAQVIGGSLKFNGGQYLERTSTAGNQTTWTWSGWIKLCDLSGNNIFGEDGGYPNASASFNNSGELRFTAAAADSSVFLNVIPSALFRDFSAWYHFVIVYDSGNAISSERARIYVNGKRLRKLSTATYPSQNVTTVVNSNGNAFRIGSHSGVDHLQGYQSNAYLIDGQAIAPGFFGFTDPLTGTWRPKRLRDGDPTASDGRTFSGASISGGGSLSNLFDGNASTSATQSSVGTSVKITGFGPVRVASHVSFYSPDGPAFYTLNGGEEHRFYSAGWHEIEFSGSLREFTWIGNSARIFIYAMKVDGVELVDATTTNINFGVNGFYLPMDDEDRFRLDQSGKNNHFTEAGWSGTSIEPDVVKDSPSGALFGGRGQTGITTTSSAPANYAVLNELNKHKSADVMSNGNLDFTTSTGGGLSASTLSMSYGKFYFESVFSAGAGSQQFAGIRKPGARNYSDSYIYVGTGNKMIDGGSATSYGDSLAHGDYIGTAFDATNGTLEFFKNGVSQGIAFTGISGSYLFFVGSYGASPTYKVNFGQKPFKYAPPQGYLPLNSATARVNKVISRPDQYVGIATYTGSGSSQQSINVGFKPDLSWAKSRSNAENHALFDSVRGSTKFLRSDSVDDQYTISNVSFIDKGISYTNASSGEINESGQRYVVWNWKAGGNKNTFNVDDVGYATFAASGTTAGTITPTGTSIGTKQGFSIIKYTGTGSAATLPHGLTQAPDFLIVKNLDSNYNWAVYHKDLTSAAYYLFLNNTDGQSNNFYTYWNSTDPSSTVISLGADSSDSNVNANKASQSHICYAWHSVPGLQKFGTYDGNNSTDGITVELGFRPALVWFKRIDSAGNWVILDTKRTPFNPAGTSMYADSASDQDYSPGNPWADILSTGFKMRASYGENNGNGASYIYCAWAEAPASNLFGGQSNAR